ncbi:putative nitrogen assimilation transcription factor nit-4 [Myxozyma melibiosi]|uniref:Nitrogen assimilation transcription factor nit-4 n=1 Tax=Myxozyma melibiosi TaxID=54550 RepID=A0ABR1FAS7_9ASCO
MHSDEDQEKWTASTSAPADSQQRARRRSVASGDRVPRACDNCSKSKSKCLLKPESSSCENCNFLNVPCTFAREVRKRGPPKGYALALENRLSSLEDLMGELRGDRGSVPAPHRAKKRALSTDDTSSESISNHSITPPTSNVATSTTTTATTTFASAPDLASTPSENQKTIVGHLSIDENLTMRYHGPTSGLHLMTFSKIYSSPFWHFPNPGFWPRTKKMIVRTEEEIVKAADETMGGVLPNLEMQDKLLDAYWTNIHPCFPVIHKSFFLSQLANDRLGLARSGTSALEQIKRRIPQVFLLSIFALAARFVEHDSDPETGYSDPGDPYASKAEYLLAQHKQSSINICMASLLMGYRELGTGGSISWTYIGNAVRMAQDLGLHRDPSVWKTILPFTNMSDDEMQIRRLVWWGVYTADQYISAWQGRPCGIHKSDFDTELPKEWPVDDESAKCFLNVIKLSQIQNDIHQAFYAVSCPDTDEGERLTVLDRRLSEWEHELPDQLKIMGDPDKKISVPVASMHAQFWTCKILLHRPFVKPTKGMEISSSHLVATSAAIAISNIAHKVCSDHGSRPSTPFMNYYCFTATIMHIFNRRNFPLLFSELSLTQCANDLKSMATVWPSARRTLQIIFNMGQATSAGFGAATQNSETNKTNTTTENGKTNYSTTTPLASSTNEATIGTEGASAQTYGQGAMFENLGFSAEQAAETIKNLMGEEFSGLPDLWDFTADLAYPFDETKPFNYSSGF